MAGTWSRRELDTLSWQSAAAGSAGGRMILTSLPLDELQPRPIKRSLSPHAVSVGITCTCGLLPLAYVYMWVAASCLRPTCIHPSAALLPLRLILGDGGLLAGGRRRREVWKRSR